MLTVKVVILLIFMDVEKQRTCILSFSHVITSDQKREGREELLIKFFSDEAFTKRIANTIKVNINDPAIKQAIFDPITGKMSEHIIGKEY